MQLARLLVAICVATSGCLGRSNLTTRPAPFPQFRSYDAVPSWSPGGQYVAYLHEPRDASDEERIAIVDSSGSASTSVVAIQPAVSPQLTWSPDGTQIAYWDGGICTVTLATHVTRRWTGPFVVDPAWSPDSRFLSFLITTRVSSAPDSTGGIHILDTQTGDERALTYADTLTAFGDYPVWSPDGSRIAFMSEMSGSGGNICIIGVGGGPLRQLTHLSGYCADLQWSTDGQTIYFHFTPSPSAFGDPATTSSWVVHADGSGLRQLPFDLGDRRVHFWFQFSLSHPGDRVAYTGMDSTGRGGVIWTMDSDGRNRRQLTSP